ncbi:uncharacterized protein [Henckelia pumila]|uniref:uncharacterized protein n=1 Tax=Henckelia pumila TaxID=405737 RepID=UPI003C6E25BC
MSVFLLPLTLCFDLERMMNFFWWGKSGNTRGGMKWQSWEKLSKHKSEGGMGFRRVQPKICLEELATQNLIRRGARCRIGSGNQTLIYGTPWLPDANDPYISSFGPPELQHAKVSDLRTSNAGEWDIDILNDLFNVRDKSLIQSIPLSLFDAEDRWIWGFDNIGLYIVKSGYKLLSSNRDNHIRDDINWLQIWQLKTPPQKCATSSGER